LAKELNMSLISIITPLYKPRREHLVHTVKSVANQILPPGWFIEWIIQEDSPNVTINTNLLTLDCISYETNGAHLGVAATRNIALARANGDLIQVLDQDDYLLPHALGTLAQHFDEPSIHWAVGQADNLNEDGTRTTWPSILPYGILEPGQANTVAAERGGNWVIHCAGLMIRTQVLRALGGWVTGWSDDDVIMFAGLSEVTRGYNDPKTTWLYRQHADQLSRTSESVKRSIRARQMALQRVTAMRDADIRVTQTTITPEPVPIATAAEKY
jgi:glycosyltransferase involved in cell wall biosynthesis